MNRENSATSVSSHKNGFTLRATSRRFFRLLRGKELCEFQHITLAVPLSYSLRNEGLFQISFNFSTRLGLNTQRIKENTE